MWTANPEARFRQAAKKISVLSNSVVLCIRDPVSRMHASLQAEFVDRLVTRKYEHLKRIVLHESLISIASFLLHVLNGNNVCK